MSKHIARLKAAAIGSVLLGAGVLPVAAADYPDGGGRPPAYHGGDAAFVDGGDDPIPPGRDPRARDGYRGAPIPFVYDERGADRRYGAPLGRRPVAAGRFGFDRPADVDPGWRDDVADPRRYGGGDRPVAVVPSYDLGDGEPREGCSVERVRSFTAAGWERIDTHRTCYRR